MGFYVLLGLLSLLISSSVQGQGRIRGLVQTKEGKPRVGATVYLLSPGIPLHQKSQLFRVKTDKRGRFRQKVPPGRKIWAWSHYREASSTGDGWNLLSSIRRGVHPSEILILKESERRPSRRMRLKGLAAWGKAEDLKLVWVLRLKRSDPQLRQKREVSMDAEGEVALPDHFPMAKTRLSFFIQTKEGRDLFEGKIYGGGRAKQTPEQPLVFSCPEPTPLSLLVREKKSGAPIAGAQVLFRHGFSGQWCRGPRSDSKGRIRFRVPKFRVKEGSLTLSLLRSGFQGANALFYQGATFVNGKKRPLDFQGGGERVRFDLAKDLPFACSILDPRGEGLEGALVHLKLYLWVHLSGDSILRIPGGTLSLRMGKDGKALIPSLPPNLMRIKSEVFFTSKTWLSLVGADSEFAVPPHPAFHMDWTSRKKTPRSLVGDLRKFRLYPFQVRGQDGGLVRFPHLRWEKKTEEVRRGVGNRKGKGFFLLPQGGACLAAWANDSGYYLEEKAGFALSPSFIAPPRELVLKRVETLLRGRVVDSEGKPLEGVRVSLVGWSFRGQSPRGNTIQEIQSLLLWGKTNAKGEYAVPFLEDPYLSSQVGFSYKGKSKKVYVMKVQDRLNMRM